MGHQINIVPPDRPALRVSKSQKRNLLTLTTKSFHPFFMHPIADFDELPPDQLPQEQANNNRGVHYNSANDSIRPSIKAFQPDPNSKTAQDTSHQKPNQQHPPSNKEVNKFLIIFSGHSAYELLM